MAKYGTFKYGDGTKYGFQPALPDVEFQFYLRLIDHNDEVIEIVRSDVTNLTWSFGINGGCRDLSVTLKRELSSYGLIGPEYFVELYIMSKIQNDFTLVWTGYIDAVSPSFARREVVIVAKGLANWLKRVVTEADFTDSLFSNLDVSQYVQGIMDQIGTTVGFGKHKAPIEFTAARVLFMGVSVMGGKVFGTAWDVISRFAEISNAAWGVGADRFFYFQPRANTVTHWLTESAQPHFVGSQSEEYPFATMTELDLQFTRRGVQDRIYMQVAGGNRYLIDSGNAIEGRERERIELATSIDNAVDAATLGAAIISDSVGATVTVEERFDLEASTGAVELMTPSQDYERGTFVVNWPNWYIKDADETIPSTVGHYSAQADGRIAIKPDFGDVEVLANYDVVTGGHIGRATVEGLRDTFESIALPLGQVALYTSKWRDYKLRLNSVKYTAQQSGMKAQLELGEVRTALGDVLDRLRFEQNEIRQGL